MVLPSLLIAISTFILKEWKFLYKLSAKLISFLTRNKNQGVYEILDYETTLELNPTGKTATFLKRQKVRFLQDNIISFQDYMWGDADTLASYSCKPGKVVDWYQEGDRWNILVSLLQSKGRGEVEEFFMETTVKSGFVKSQEWQQQEIRHKTKRLKMSIVFPKQRHCRKAMIQQRSTHESTELGIDHFSDLPDGRQLVTWEAKNIEPLEIYTLRWEW